MKPRPTSHRRNPRLLAAVTSLGFGLVACSSDVPTRSASLSTQSSAITGWEASDVTSADLPFRAVGALSIPRTDGVGGCTGTLVRRDLVLTAAHCFCHRADLVNASDIHFTLLQRDAAGNNRALVINGRHNPGEASVLIHSTCPTR